MTMTMARRHLLRRLLASSTTNDSLRVVGSRRPYSTSSPRCADPSRFVHGVTSEQVETNPVIAAYYAANFPDHATVDLSPPPPAPVEPIDPLAARNIRRLTCVTRDRDTEDGTRACEILRENHLMIPGILYGSNPTQNILSVNHDSKVMVKTSWNKIQSELDRYHHAFENRVYALTITDDVTGEVVVDEQLVIPRDLQRHPVQHKVYCVNYLRYHPARPIKIPIVYVNEEESPALKRGGFIVPINRTMEVVVEDGVPIPEKLELECTGLRLKQVLRTERIILPDGVTMGPRVDPKTFLVGTVYGRRMGDDMATIGGEGAEGEEGGEAS